MTNNPAIGFSYLFKGATLLTQPGLRLFVLIPLTINLVIFSILAYIAIDQFQIALDWALSWVPDFLLSMAKWLLSLTFGLFLLIIFGYSFSLVANIIAAPFNGLLAEKVEQHLTGQAPPPEAISAMILRTIGRELRKLCYFLPRAFFILIICMIPPITFIAPIIIFLWGAWSMAIQYLDYPMDNHQIEFSDLKNTLKQQQLTSYGFGGSVMILTMIPGMNLFIIPVAVAGATALWVEHYPRPEAAKLNVNLTEKKPPSIERID